MRTIAELEKAATVFEADPTEATAAAYSDLADECLADGIIDSAGWTYAQGVLTTFGF